MKILKAVVAAAGVMLMTQSALADTPPRTLVVAKSIDDIVSLDPAQAFEFTGGEILANVYDRMMRYGLEEPSKLTGELAESWKISPDGKTIAFTLRPGAKFASGNLVRPEDVVFTYQRVIKLNKAPAFILGQLGWKADNVEQLVRKTGEREVTVTVTEEYAPSFVLNALAARPASIVDEVEVSKNQKDGDLGNAWLSRNSAGSGPFRLRTYRANDTVVLEANPNYSRAAPAMQQIIFRHVPEPATQRIMLEQGDIDIARDLGPDQIKAVRAKQDLKVAEFPLAAVHFVSLNQKQEKLRNPALWEAIRYLVDYEGIAGKLLNGQMKVHQAYWPTGFPGALTDTPFKLDVAKAKEILAKAGLQDGVSADMDVINLPMFMDVAQSLQETMGQANIKLNLVPGTGSQVISKYRARGHQVMLLYWGPDFMDTHSNAKAFSYNVDNADGAPQSTTTWRNAWLIPELSEKTRAALLEKDTAKREQMYLELQRVVQKESPIIIMFQGQAQVAMRDKVKGYFHGPVNDMIFYRGVTKD
ncbi:MAG: ABC transporter substrate-binding protein [Proteobacteria bacterium]|nr:ABC transporter substrate-binding protein [Pseudomonadota bacterium]